MKRRWIRSYKEFPFGICQCGCGEPIVRLVFKGILRKRLPTHWYGRFKSKKGYVYVQDPENPDANRAGYVPEHRKVLSIKLGRRLRPDEDTHHINHIKDDNRPENLVVIDKKSHGQLHRWS